jgi:hypothetical protein
MSKVKQAIETALENISNATSNTYGAKLYTFDQVAMILQDIYATATETDEDGIAVLTPDMIGDLVEKIEARIDTNINDMSDSDIVDEDSIEMSISGGRASVESIDVDKDQIVSDANYGIDDTITNWAQRHGIFNEN